ncbi:MAG: M18 family aminopeptidase, partial [Selenomonadaceae bacterium]|nr:M18 family aminopeptidase [Selenomonadaceae bacterium]
MPETAQRLLEYIGRCTSPFHAVAVGAGELEDAGFREIFPEQPWKLEWGGRYFLRVYGSTLLAFAFGNGPGALRMAAAHTDVPCLRLKPETGFVKDGYGMLNVEAYGGMVFRSWLDRPLSLAGKVVLRGKDAFHPEARLMDFGRPLLTVPGLAIHMDREVNEKGGLNCQKDMIPLAML